MSATRKTWLALAPVAVLLAIAYGVACERFGWFPSALVDSVLPAAPAEPAPAPPSTTPTAPPDGSTDDGDDEPDQHFAPPAPQRQLAPRFHRARPAATTGDGDQVSVVPYAGGVVPAGTAQGVTLHDAGAAYAGLNLMVSGHAPEALLLDMDGNAVHRWSCAFAAVWPGPLRPGEGLASTTYWRRVHLFPNGDLLAIFEGLGMVKLDRDSRLLWKYRGNPHHDIDVDAAGNIYTLTRQTVAQKRGLRGPIIEDFITVLSPQGREKRKVSVIDAILASKYASVFARRVKNPDVLHTNTIELLDGRHAARFPVLRANDVLISIRNLDMVAVVDLEREVVTWAMTEIWRRQHQPTVLDDGHVLVFDNRGNGGMSRVLELDPATHEIVWAYEGSDDMPLRSWTLGSCQRLPNGNTLITESEPGRVIEVTPDKAIVWEYVNPERAPENHDLIASVFEMVRIDPSAIEFPLQGRRDAPTRR